MAEMLLASAELQDLKKAFAECPPPPHLDPFMLEPKTSKMSI
jgi:hypothetical protein